jgi:hypothetical protein
VSITNPSPGSAFTVGQAVVINASAADADGTVAKVDFYANGVLIGTARSTPFAITWLPGAVGSYSLVAVATDNANASTTSGAITVSAVPAPPVAKVTRAIWRPSTARWHIDVDFDQVVDQKVYLGMPTDTPIAGRIDPGRSYDLVVYRNGIWYADLGRRGVVDFMAGFGGVPGDVPLLADFNGDGRDDLVIYRNGLWYVSTAQVGVVAMTFGFGGVPGDVPLAGDVNGDGIADLVIYRNGLWYIDTGRTGTVTNTVALGGVPGDIPLLFDYDGDGKADLCISRNGIWYVNTKLDSTVQAMFGYGTGGDVPFAWRD